MKTQSFEVGLSGFYHIVFAILNTKLPKSESKNWFTATWNFNIGQSKSGICNSMENVRAHLAFEKKVFFF